MKEFFKMTLATICGIAIFLVVTGLFFVISLVGMIASDSASTKVKDNSVFVIKLDGTISERVEADSPINAILGMGDMSAMGLNDLIARCIISAGNPDLIGVSSFSYSSHNIFLSVRNLWHTPVSIIIAHLYVFVKCYFDVILNSMP